LERTRVLLMGMPTMLRQVVREVVARVPEFVVVGEFPTADLDEARGAGASVAIVGAADVSERWVRQLLRGSCRLRVLSISVDGSQTTLYEMRPHRVPLGELGPEALVAAIRAAGDEA
jgi:hypothetical protein